MYRPDLMRTLACAVAVTCIQFSGPAHAKSKEKRSTLDDQQAVAITIYNQDLALVKDIRQLKLGGGQIQLAMREVSAKMRPETAQLRSLSHPDGFRLLEQNFDFDLLTPAKLLEKYVGRTVRIIKTHPTTGDESVEEALVLSVNQGVVLKIGDRIETRMPGRIVYDEVPENLRDRPTLVMDLNNHTAATQEVELSYLTGGLSWKADYVAELSAEDGEIDLNGWVTLTNESGTSYPRAQLQLVAGDVNRVRQAVDYARTKVGMLTQSDAAAPSMSQESLFEYHLYTLNRKTDISDNQTKQVSLLSASDVPVVKELVLKGNDYYYRASYGGLGQKMKVGVYVKFDNRKTANLGLPMPKGTVRVYKRDSSGNAQFVGEDHIDHTPENEQVSLRLGNAFDVTAKKKQTDFKKRSGDSRYNYVFESAYEVVLKNAKTTPVTVTVQEPVPGDWKMLNESHKHTEAAAGTAVWTITIPAKDETKLNYRVMVRY